MSPNFKKLVDASSVTMTGFDYRFGNTSSTYFDKEKFAKLVIEECFNATITKANDPANPTDLMDVMKVNVGLK